MIETLFLIWLIGSCINAVLIVYYFWPVQTSELIIRHQSGRCGGHYY
jgi:hypothetical protein